MTLTVTPYITVDNAAEALDFYKDAFGATELMRLSDPNDGRIGHAEVLFGDAKMMISDEFPDFGAVGPAALGGTPVKLVLTVAAADDVYAKAVAAGATSLREMRDEFHGHRSGQIMDPFGHIWFIQSKIKDMTAADMQKIWDEMTRA